MPTRSKKTSKKAVVKRSWRTPFVWLSARIAAFRAKRPHRSFRRTKRRDALKPLNLPGFLAFTIEVNKTLWAHRKTFILLGIIYAALYALLVGIGSQQTYSTLSETLQDTGSQVFEGNWGEIGKAGLLFATIATVGITEAPSETQQIFAVLLVLMGWMTTIWLLRNYLAKRNVKLRDALYNAGAPIIATLGVAIVLAVQLIPVAIAAVGYAAATNSGLIAGGVEAMMFWFAAGLLGILSLFWITSTFFAMVIVTIPGMYPFRALSTAGDMVLGRRVKILLRWAWLALVSIVTWVLVLVPVILFDTWLKSTWTAVAWLPLVPVVILILATLTTIWSSSYIYLLYRKIVDEDARHA